MITLEIIPNITIIFVLVRTKTKHWKMKQSTFSMEKVTKWRHKFYPIKALTFPWNRIYSGQNNLDILESKRMVKIANAERMRENIIHQ